MKNYDIVIIGSGLGGLLCGYILSKEGFNVCILEKHTQPGGNLQNFSRQGLPFDTGVHYVGGLSPGQPLYAYWNYIGLAGMLSVQRLDMDGFDRITVRGEEFVLAQGFDHFMSQLLTRFPKEEKALLEYTDQLKKIASSYPLYNLQLPDKNINEPHRSSGAFHYFSALTQNKQLQATLAGNNFLYAGNPDKTPLHMVALINHSFISSAWRLREGSKQIADILVGKIKSLGGTVLTSNQVRIVHADKENFTIRTTSDDYYQAKKVISNIHPLQTIRILDPSLVKTAGRFRLENLKNTTSSFILNLVMKPGTFPYMNYNVHFFNTENVWTSTTSKGTRWPQNYLLYTPLHDPADPWAKTVIILTYMDFDEVRRWEDTVIGKRGDEYRAFKHDRSERLLNLVEEKFPGIKRQIAYSEASTPLTYRDYTGTIEGSLYGIQKDYNDPLETMILPRNRIPNLFFTGQNVSLHGMLGVTIGAILTCGEILGLEYLLNKIRRT